VVYSVPLRIEAGALHRGSPITTSSQPTNREAAYRLSASMNPDVFSSIVTEGDASGWPARSVLLNLNLGCTSNISLVPRKKT
jgi:hypothetical protein